MKKLISTQEAISLLDCSIHTFKGYIRRGALYPCKKEGGRSYFSKDTIEQFTPPREAIKKNRNPSERKSTGIDQSEMRDVIGKWRVNSHDTSSSDVQIGIYTEKIQQLEHDMKSTDYENTAFSGMRKLLVKYVFERRRLLNYLQSSDYTRYRRAIKMINRKSTAA